MRLVYITLARKILCYGSFPAKVSLGTNAYNSQNIFKPKSVISLNLCLVMPSCRENPALVEEMAGSTWNER